MKRFEPRGAEGAEAWDVVFRRKVALERFPRGLDRRGSGARLHKCWSAWLAASHPGFFRPGLLDLNEGWLVREWAHGFSLLDLLRHRRKLEAAEAIVILAAAAPILDHAAENDLLADFDLNKWFVHFHAASADEIARNLLDPLECWPAWTLKFEPISVANATADASDQTAVGKNGGGSKKPSAVVALHDLLLELLGRPKVRAGTPLSGLGAAINNLLPSALDPRAFPCAAAFADAVLGAFPKDSPLPKPPDPNGPVREYGIPAHLRQKGTAGDTISFEPLGGTAHPIRIVARREFRFGRAVGQSDLVARFSSHVPNALALTKCMGRVHLAARIEHGEISLFDGTEGSPSHNGSFLNGAPIESSSGTLLRGPALLQLADQWQAALVPAPRTERVSFVFDKTDLISSPAESLCRWAALFVQPGQGSHALEDACWLLEEAGFGLDGDGKLVWDTESLAPAPAAFRRVGDSFFLVNRNFSDGEISLNAQPIPVRAAAPLSDGLQLTAGKSAWRLHIA